MRNFVKKHPKTSGLIATVAVAAAAYYGIPPSALAPIGAFFGF